MGQVSVSPGVLCEEKFKNFLPLENEVYCPWVWDRVLCWPPTRAGVTYSQPCPKGIRIDHTKFVSRVCSSDGKWGGKVGEDSGIQGWTNYTTCFSTELTQLMKKLHSGGDHSQAQKKLDIAEKTRILEFFGLSLSLAALIISLAIFCRFRVLRNNRTRIHKNLFIAMVIQVVTRLTLYIDQAIIRKPSIHQFQQGIDNTSILCEGAYILLEYARTAMFMWMFIEGLYLHNVVTVRVLQENTHYRVYTAVGWGAPVLMTAAWSGVTAVHIKTDCWAGYNLNPSYWILEGPRMAVIILNFLFLLNIIRVLIVKLRQSRTSELEQARKAVRAALVLLPLLGITNLINMTEAPLERPVWEFAAWSYITHFLTSFQGVFISFLYCFLNGEVRTAVSKSVSTYLWIQRYNPPVARRNSAYITVSGRPSIPQAPSETRV